MRLIDADALKEKAWDADTRCGYVQVVDVGDIDEAPTIDPESLRKKGEWIWSEEDECWVCSNCEAPALNNYRGNSTDSPFCPNCGADMRGEKHE